jgi:magnesium chelatase accessory protein
LKARRLVWDIDGEHWPNRHSSRFVEVAGLRWHVQRMGAGPSLLLVHGTGAATHSWAGLAPRLAAGGFDVIAVDLPGHGFSDPLPFRQMSVEGLGDALGGLLRRLEANPRMAVGHSAGAAIVIDMALRGCIEPGGLVGLNAALLPLRALAGVFFSPMARLLAVNPLAPWLFSKLAGDARAVRRLIEGTGSRIDAQAIEHYRTTIASEAHVAGALAMMANWDLQPLQGRLARLRIPLLLIAGLSDRTVPAGDSQRACERIPGSRFMGLERLGHLAHEEDPKAVSRILLGQAKAWGLLEGDEPAG